MFRTSQVLIKTRDILHEFRKYKRERIPHSVAVKFEPFEMNSLTILAILAVTIGFSGSSFSENVNDDRIYGGSEPWAHRHPYTVSLREQSTINNTVGWFVHRCGGSIISNRWILTAALCASQNSVEKTAVVVGAHHIRDDGQVYLLNRVIKHPSFNKANHHNDLALLRTIQEIQLGPRVQPIPLRRQFVDKGIVAIITGWGKKFVRKRMV